MRPFNCISVGDTFPISLPENSVMFDINSNVLMCIISYYKPTDKEICDISSPSPFEIRSMVRNGVLWFVMKCGSQPWVDAPFSPHLSKNLFLQNIADDISGYPLTLILIDAADNTVKEMRVISLGNRFSKAIRKNIEELLAEPFDSFSYKAAIDNMYCRYSSSQMAKMSSDYYRLKG